MNTNIIKAPSHVKDYCKIIKDTNYEELKSFLEDDEFCGAYKIECKCGCEFFDIYWHDMPECVVECRDCKNRIVLYDLAMYPCAVKPDVDYQLKKISLEPVEVFVCYEFPEDMEDYNDVSWGYVYVIDGDKMTKIIDDETA